MELLIVTAGETGPRIDAWLPQAVPGLTRSAAQRMLENGEITLNGLPVKKNHKLTAGEEFTVVLNDAVEIPILPQDIPLDVVFEDDDVIVVNKPRGMVVHPAPGHPMGTLVNALLYQCG